MKFPALFRLAIAIVCLFRLASSTCAQEARISIDEDNPWYWAIDGKPTVLLGANKTDHPFLIPDYKQYLDELRRNGGNFLRNVLSQREPEPHNRPHRFLDNGKYDLDQWNDSYFDRLDAFLSACQERGIIVSIELWDKFDYQGDYFAASAWRPANNVNYTLEESGLLDSYTPTHRSPEKNAHHTDNPFLHTVPELKNNTLLLKHQVRFIRKALSVTLKHPNVIYFVGNEWKESKQWPVYWTNLVHRIASDSGVSVPVSLMVWSSSTAFQPELNFVARQKDLFNFAGFRVGNPKIPFGQGHYDRILEVKQMLLREGPRPMVDPKVRTAKGFYSPTRQGRVWRGLMAGWSGLSHHRVHIRPDNTATTDLGFTPAAQANVRSMRRFVEDTLPWKCSPANHLLGDRDEDEAYLIADPGRAYGLYFVKTGAVSLTALPGEYRLTWINIQTGAFTESQMTIASETITLQPPNPGDSKVGWAATLVRKQP